MLNCCVAEQNRVRALATSTLTLPADAALFLAPPPGAASAATPLPESEGVSTVIATPTAGDELNGACNGRKAEQRGAADSEAPPQMETLGGGGISMDEGGMTDADVAVATGENVNVFEGNHSDRKHGAVVLHEETQEERSARMKATFAAERDAILRRVGVKKEGDSGGGGGGAWWMLGQGRQSDVQHGSSTASPASPQSRPDADDAVGGNEGGGTVLGAEDSETTAGERGTGGAPPDGQHKQFAESDREGTAAAAAPIKRSGKVGGAVRRVGGAVRTVGRAVKKVRGRPSKNQADESVDEVESVDGVEGVPGQAAPVQAVFRGEKGARGKDGNEDGSGGTGTVGPTVDTRGWRSVDSTGDGAAGGPRLVFTGERLLVTGEW